MSSLIIDNHLITEPIISILKSARDDITSGKLGRIEDKGSYVSVTCPFHKGGMESRPSCSVYSGEGTLQKGWFHCFTCGEHGPLQKFLAGCFDSNEAFSTKWLLDRYGDNLVSTTYELEDIVIPEKVKTQKSFLPESILEQFEPYHPYMTKRKLSDEVIKKYDVKYDPKMRCIVFPVRDKYGRLSYLTKRSIDSKKFYIDTGADKSNIYLLYDAIVNKSSEVYVCESQINALTLASWGYQAIALIGAGTTSAQIAELNKTNIKHYILCYDGDEAGQHGINKFISEIRKDVFVDIVKFPDGKDVNDLTKEEFECLMNS